MQLPGKNPSSATSPARQIPVLDDDPKTSLLRFLDACSAANFDARRIGRIARETIAHLRGSKMQREASAELQTLERRWYASLDVGKPDYSVYAEPDYLGELWACWFAYSKTYLRAMRRIVMTPRGSIPDDLAPARRVIDLGCGFGYTTLALRGLFPDAMVYGTNLLDTPQGAVARALVIPCGVGLCETLSPVLAPADLVFASEYFEHFERPVDHLVEVVNALQPRALLIANTFNADSIGHFRTYVVNGERMPGPAASRAFNAWLREHGYVQSVTKMWNNRPTYWKRA